MAITNIRAAWSNGKLQFIDEATKTVVFEIDTTGPDARAPIKETISSNKTLDEQDTGKILEVDTDAVVITLPATAVGLFYHIRNVGADGAVGINIDPATADMIKGPDSAGVNDKDWINTKATAKKGDYVKIVGDGLTAAGWKVVEQSGTWAAEA